MKNMKKSIVLLAALALLAAPVFAAAATHEGWVTSGIGDATGGGGGVSADDIKTSAGVLLYYGGEDTGNYFAIGTYNTKGTKAYTTNQDSSKLWVSKSDFEASGDVDIFVAAASTYTLTTDFQEVGK